MPFPKSRIPDYNNKKDMEVSLATNKEWDKNDFSQIPEKYKDAASNGSNGNANLQNGLLQFAANEIAKGK